MAASYSKVDATSGSFHAEKCSGESDIARLNISSQASKPHSPKCNPAHRTAPISKPRVDTVPLQEQRKAKTPSHPEHQIRVFS